MNTVLQQTYPASTNGFERGITLALSLAQAEKAIHAFAAGQIDAIIDPDGKTYLLRPAQEHLRQNESRLQAILDSTCDGIVVLDHDGVIVSRNRAAIRMFAREAGNLEGRSFYEFVDPANVPQLQIEVFNIIEGIRAAALVEFHLRGQDGVYCRVEATLGKLRDTTAGYVVLTCRNVLKESGEEPSTGNETAIGKDRFLAMLSHELRTPLTPILLGIFALQHEKSSPDTMAILGMMRRNLELHLQLLDELSDFTSLGQHKIRLELEPIDVHEAIRFALEICQSDLDAMKIELSLDLCATESMVIADAVRLQQVIWNLIKNAVKFSATGGAISVSSMNDADGRLRVIVADQGIGIESKLLPLVFDPFEQGDLSKTHRKGGMGLGLYIARGLAEAQGGTLTVLSEGRGKGALFSLTLTAAPTGSASSQ